MQGSDYHFLKAAIEKIGRGGEILKSHYDIEKITLKQALRGIFILHCLVKLKVHYDNTDLQCSAMLIISGMPRSKSFYENFRRVLSKYEMCSIGRKLYHKKRKMYTPYLLNGNDKVEAAKHVRKCGYKCTVYNMT